MVDMARPDSPLVCFVVLNWNQPDLTSECLDSLARQDYANCRVIVVDNGSTDNSADVVRQRHPWVEVLEIAHNIGYSPGNNVGLECALQQDADYVFLLNNDTEVDPHMLSQLVEVAGSEVGIGMVGPTMYYVDPSNMIWGGDNRIDWKRARLIRHRFGELDTDGALRREQPKEVDYIDTCGILVKRQVIEHIGLMDGRYFINFDDLDWNTRARKAGYKIIYVPPARLWHKVSATMGIASPATTYYMTRNALLFFWTHGPGIWKVLAPLQIILRTLRPIGAWTLKSRYRTELFRRKRDANLLALRDFFLGRFGKMGPDVARVCYGDGA